MRVNKLLIVFYSNVSLEVLNLLILFSKKYNFIKLRKIEGNVKSSDFENNILLESIEKLNNSNLCFLIGVNARYEGSHFNLKLRQCYLKGNFKIVSLGSSLDLTVPVSHMY